MSDYLGNLLQRSFAPAAVIRPRLAARFEPPGTGNAGDTSPELPHEVESRAQTPGPRRRPRATESTLAPTSPRGTDAEELELPNGEAPRTAPAPDAGFPDQPLAPPNQSHPSPRPANLRVSARASVDASRVVSANLPLAATEPGALSEPLERSATAGSQSAPATRANAAKADADAEAAPPHPGARTREPDFALARPSLRRERGASPAPSSGPTVQITIGRVEVRAASTPAVNRPAPGKGPELTLDAYLRRRAEGGRR